MTSLREAPAETIPDGKLSIGAVPITTGLGTELVYIRVDCPHGTTEIHVPAETDAVVARGNVVSDHKGTMPWCGCS